MKKTALAIFIALFAGGHFGLAWESPATVGCFQWPHEYRGEPLSGELSAKRFEKGRFAVASYLFPQLPAEGYPIQFLKDGKVETDNLLGVVYWRIGLNNKLELLDVDRKILYSFRYSDECKSLVHMRNVTGKDLQALIEIVAVKSTDPTSNKSLQPALRREPGSSK